ncbi:MAG: MarR family winged helix-turn-helix transcriptional regulator [Alphaproteobacteria bacterium]
MSEIADTEDGVDAGEVLAICGSFNLRKASRALTQMFDEALQPTGLRSTQLVILLVLARDGETGMSGLSRELVLSPSTLSRNLRPLEREGLLRIGGNGQRGKRVRLTPAGREAIRRAVPYWQEVQERFTRQVGADSWREMTARLDELVMAVRGTEE